VTTNQVLLGVGLIVALAVGSQVLASRLRIPAIILLLSAGFTAGAITTDVNPQQLLGRRSSRWCHWPWPSSSTTRACR
jgi:NhaP-type Na+/H+ or K+/H+ antiporter